MLDRFYFALYVIFLFLFVTEANASVHSLQYNIPSSIRVVDGDTLNFLDIPTDWLFSKVKIGISGEPAQMLDGRLSIGFCTYNLTGFYTEIEVPYGQQLSAVYHGPTKTLPIHWWVDYGMAEPSCSTDEVDSLKREFDTSFDSLYNIYTEDYNDLGELNSVKHFGGASLHFKISQLPQFYFNTIRVLIEPEDGDSLDGALYSREIVRKINGWSMNVPISLYMGRYAYFEIAFPEYRRFRIKWWVSVEDSPELEIPTEVRDRSQDSIEVSYQFDSVGVLQSNPVLLYRKNDFVDGLPPRVKMLQNNPHGNELKDSAFFPLSEVYDIHANTREGVMVPLAIPLNMDIAVGKDDVAVKHFVSSQQRWINEPVDSVSNGFVYFKSSTFSNFFVDLIGFVGTSVVTGPAIAADCWFNGCSYTKEGLSYTKEGLISVGEGAWSVIKWTKKLRDSFVENVCKTVDVDPFAVKYVLNDPFEVNKGKNWDIDQGEPANLIDLSNSNASKIMLQLLLKIVSESKQKLQPFEIDDTEVDKWNKAIRNLDILLADKLKRKYSIDIDEYFLEKKIRLLPLGQNLRGYRKFDISQFKLKFEYVNESVATEYAFQWYLMPPSAMLEGVSWFREGIAQCYQGFDFWNYENKDQWLILAEDVLNVDRHDGTCKNVMNMLIPNFSPLDIMFPLNRGCNEFIMDALSRSDFVQDMLSDRDKKLIAMTSVMARVALMSWIDKTDFRRFAAVAYRPLYDGMRSWLELVAPLYGDNNICIKAYAALALFEYVQYGTLANYKLLENALKKHYSENGAYSEGAGYSLYIWEEVPYLLAALKDAFESKNKQLVINKNFLHSAENMAKLSRPVESLGLVPVETDDGCTYNPDYLVWAKLLNDPKYVSLSKRFPVTDPSKVSLMNVFGIKANNMSLYSTEAPLPIEMGGRYGDDAVMIMKERILADGSIDTVSLSMVVESNDIWKNGQGHDQQDNLSITLASSAEGFIIQDRGYSGYEDRSMTHRFYQHNVLTRSQSGFTCHAPFTETCIDIDAGGDNEFISFKDLKSRTNQATGTTAGIFAYSIEFLGSKYDYSFFDDDAKYMKVAGGFQATLMKSAATGGSFGYTPKLGGVDAYTARISSPDNYRTIMYFAGNFWVIDRPREQGLVWLANSPFENWSYSNVRVFVSSNHDFMGKESIGDNQPIVQNNYDYYGNKINLSNYWYALQDVNARTYVMNYELDGPSFIRKMEGCPNDCQCFVSTDGQYKMVVPPRDEIFKLNEAFEGFPNRLKSDAIVLGENINGIWDFVYINGTYWGYKQTEDLESSSSSALSGKNRYTDLPGKRLLLMLR